MSTLTNQDEEHESDMVVHEVSPCEDLMNFGCGTHNY